LQDFLELINSNNKILCRKDLILSEWQTLANFHNNNNNKFYLQEVGKKKYKVGLIKLLVTMA